MWAAGDGMTLSVVTTLFKSAGHVEEFHRRASEAAAALTDDYEIVMVDDGSPDDSLAVALSILKRDRHLRVVELSRNFGHHRALMTGLMHARGEFCFLIDSDLEEDPALLSSFWATLHETGMDVVYGYQPQREGHWIRRWTGDLAYGILRLMIPYEVPRNHITLRLMRRNYVDSLLLHKEQQTIIGGLWIITGYRQLGVPVNKIHRADAGYSFRRRWNLLIDGIASFSDVPLVIVFYTGIAISIVSAALVAWVVLRWAVGGVGVPGWVSVMLSVWLLGGLTILFIGIIGIYLSKVFLETKHRPYSIVRAMHEHSEAP
jgi:putative glycosyltransferase